MPPLATVQADNHHIRRTDSATAAIMANLVPVFYLAAAAANHHDYILLSA